MEIASEIRLISKVRDSSDMCRSTEERRAKFEGFFEVFQTLNVKRCVEFKSLCLMDNGPRMVQGIVAEFVSPKANQ